MGVTVGSWWWVGLVVSNGFGLGLVFIFLVVLASPLCLRS